MIPLAAALSWLRVSCVVAPHGDDVTIALPYARVRGTTIAGYVDAGDALRGRAAGGATLVVIPLLSGGSMGETAALVFTQAGGRKRYVGALRSADGHLDVALHNGVLVERTPVYADGDPDCCPGRERVRTLVVRGTRIVQRSDRVVRLR